MPKYDASRDEITVDDRAKIDRSGVRLNLVLASKEVDVAVSRATLRKYVDELRGLANTIEALVNHPEQRLPAIIIRIKQEIDGLNGRNRWRAREDIQSYRETFGRSPKS